MVQCHALEQGGDNTPPGESTDPNVDVLNKITTPAHFAQYSQMVDLLTTRGTLTLSICHLIPVGSCCFFNVIEFNNQTRVPLLRVPSQGR